MNDYLIHRPKLIPPDVRSSIRRERLLERVATTKYKRLVVINAGPGYGKTTLMAQLFQALGNINIWYQLDENDSDFRYFFEHLVEGIRLHVPGFWQEQELPVTGSLESTLTAFINQISGIDQPVNIFIDDLHLLANRNETARAIEFLLTHLPPACCIFVAARSRPVLSMAKLRTQRMLLELDESDMAFSIAELSKILESSSGKKSAQRDAEEFHMRSEGWPMGVMLMQKACKARGSKAGQASAVQFQSYLTRELWDFMADDLKKLLVHACFAQEIDPDICDTILKTSESSSRLLQRAAQKNLMIVPLEGSRLFRFHPMFREFLQHRFEIEYGAEATRALHSGYAALYEQGERIDLAINHWLHAAEHERAAEALENIGHSYLISGRSGAVSRWLSMLPPTVRKSRPWLLYFDAYLDYKHGNIASGLKKAALAQAGFDDCGEQKGIFLACVLQGELYGNRTENERCLRAYQKALKVARDPFEKVDIMGRLAVQNLVVGDTAEALVLLDGARELCGESMGALRRRISVSRLNALYFMGDFKQLNLEVERLSRDETLADNNLDLFSVLFYKILGRFECGDYDGSLSAIDEAFALEDLLQGFNMAFRALQAQNLLYTGSGRRGRRIIEELFEQPSEHRLLGPDSTLNYLGAWERQNGNMDRAIDLHHQSLTMSENEQKPYAICSSLMNLAADCFKEERSLEEGLGLMNRASQMAAGGNYRYLEAQIHFHLSCIAFDRGDDAATGKHIRKALVLADEYGYDHVFRQEGRSRIDLLTFAFGHDIERAFVTSVLAGIGAQSIEAILPFFASENVELRMAAIPAALIIGRENAIPHIRRLVRDPVADVRTAAEIALQEYRSLLQVPEEVLSGRELDVLKLIGEGLSNADIGARLFITESTVKTYVSRIFNKLGLSKRAQVIAFYHKLGLAGDTPSPKRP